MNKAQKNLKKLIVKTPHGGKERQMLQEAFRLWGGYEDSQYSYPAWGLKALEARYGLKISDIADKYGRG